MCPFCSGTVGTPAFSLRRSILVVGVLVFMPGPLRLCFGDHSNFTFGTLILGCPVIGLFVMFRAANAVVSHEKVDSEPVERRYGVLEVVPEAWSPRTYAVLAGYARTEKNKYKPAERREGLIEPDLISYFFAMAFSFYETSDALIYQERISPLLRTGIAGIGITMLMVPYALIHAMGGLDAVSPAKLEAMLAVLGATVFVFFFSVICLKIALFVPRQTLAFDKKARLIVYTPVSPITRKAAEYYKFSDVTGIGLIEHPLEDSSATYAIEISTIAGTPIIIGAFYDRTDADERIHQIRRVIACASDLSAAGSSLQQLTATGQRALK